eukprot:3542492-Rhodomonas_salina.2
MVTSQTDSGSRDRERERDDHVTQRAVAMSQREPGHVTAKTDTSTEGIVKIACVCVRGARKGDNAPLRGRPR